MNNRAATTVQILALICLVVAATGGQRVTSPNRSQSISMKPLPLDPAHPGPRRVGELIFLNAWEMRSDNADFGGISALASLPDRGFIGVGDNGTLIGFGVPFQRQADRSFIEPLPLPAGDKWSFRDRDSEGIAHDPATGQFWISFEHHHAIRRFNRAFSRMTGSVRPDAMQRWPRNRGAEGIARLANGRFLLISESREDDGTHQGLLFSGDPVEVGTTTTRFFYRPPAGYRPTDAAQLPDGRLVILNRRISLYHGFAAKLDLADPAAIATDEVLDGSTMATLTPPLLIDNMEGLAVSHGRGETLIWLISDNNFTILQRTLLMQFRLAERSLKKKPEAAAASGFDPL